MYAFFPAAAAALHPPLQCIFPPSCCYLLLFAAYLGGRGDVTPLREGYGRRVTDADVKLGQTRRRLMATLSLERVRVLQTDKEATEPPSHLPPSTPPTKKICQLPSEILPETVVSQCVQSVGAVWGAGGEGDAHRLGCAQPSIMKADYFLLSIKERLISGSPLKGIIQQM